MQEVRRELSEENQRPYEPQEEQQFERTSVDGDSVQPAPATPAGRQVSGAPPASPDPLESE